MDCILKVTNATKYYGTGAIVTKALDGVSLEMEKGDFTAIMGASGSGKSTLLNVISTIDKVSSGEVEIGSRRVSDMNDSELAAFRRDMLGFIFQDYNLLDTLTIGENITLPLSLKKASAEKIALALTRAATALGVNEQLEKFPSEVSGGQRQRAACTRALITEPALILADEPTGALDSVNSKALMRAITMMNERYNATILMVTHDPMVGSYAKRVLFLRDGKIMSELFRGDRDRHALHTEITSVNASLGGDTFAD